MGIVTHILNGNFRKNKQPLTLTVRYCVYRLLDFSLSFITDLWKLKAEATPAEHLFLYITLERWQEDSADTTTVSLGHPLPSEQEESESTPCTWMRKTPTWSAASSSSIYPLPSGKSSHCSFAVSEFPANWKCFSLWFEPGSPAVASIYPLHSFFLEIL